MESWTQSLAGWAASAGQALGPYAPRLFGAVAIGVAAWLGARLVRLAVLRAATAARLDERSHSRGLAATLAGVGAAGVWLLALPALLGALELQGLLTPVNAMLSRLLGFVPNLFGSAVVLGVGLLVAGIARQLVVGLLQAAGSEKAAARMGLGTALGAGGLAGVAGSALYALILLPTLVAALQPLGLDALTQTLNRLLDTVTALIPRLLSAAILVGVAVLIGRALASLASAVLAGMGLDKLPEKLGAAPFGPGARKWSDAAGSLVMLAVVAAAITQASEIVGLSVLTEIVATLGAAAARVVVAGALMLAGLFLAMAAARALQASSLRNAGMLAQLARGAILFFAAALALRQAGLPAEIVTIAFAAVIGALALGLGVALGVGGRHAAGRVMERLVQSFEAPTAEAALRQAMAADAAAAAQARSASSSATGAAAAATAAAPAQTAGRA